jgi:hypothetical protein
VKWSFLLLLGWWGTEYCKGRTGVYDFLHAFSVTKSSHHHSGFRMPKLSIGMCHPRYTETVLHPLQRNLSKKVVDFV